MAEDRLDPRDFNWRHWLPWTVLFRGFQVALDLKKLLLAAGGILTMACGWWLLATVFFAAKGNKPNWPSDYPTASYEVKNVPEERRAEASTLEAWKAFKRDRARYNVMYEAAAPSDHADRMMDAGDLAETPADYEIINAQIIKGARTIEVNNRVVRVEPKLGGRLRTWPWFEDRGPNPYLLLAGQAGYTDEDGVKHRVPWERGHFADWLLREQVPVLLEPLVKFLRPVGYLLHPAAGFVEHLYFLLVILWTVATWAFFGGAISRLAVVQVARNEKIGLSEAARFVWSKKVSYFFASLAPLVFVAVITALLWIFGLFNLIGFVGDVVDGIFWPLVLLGGLAMAVALVGLVGWPMIHATLSAEGSDSFDALSRSYSYVYQAPWQYLWYAAVALTYGAVVVFFVSLMGSLTVYLGKWGVGQTAGASYFNRDPSYLFVWSPTSYHWRELLTRSADGSYVDAAGNAVGEGWHWYNYLGVTLVNVWVFAFFLLIVGFGYSYFWSSSTIIYLLMRRKVDDTEMDEVYLEEEEAEDSYTTTSAPAPPSPATPGLTMVEAPTLRPAASPPASVSVGNTEAAAKPASDDGNPPPT